MINVGSAELADIRSKLFVPGSRPELFAKALAGDADALSFDLEDSVVNSRKDEARQAVSRFLEDNSAPHNKIIIVRVNAIGNDNFLPDITAAAVTPVHVINLPKVEAAEDVLTVADAVERIEKKTSRIIPIKILANIETPRGLRRAYEIATAHPRLMGLQIGFVDLSRACGFEDPNLTALNSARMTVRLAASEAGIAAFDGAFVDARNLDGFRREAEEARSFGITGKSCIHPSQVPLANETFAPNRETIQAALRIVQAAGKAAEDGIGAFLLDGKMIDTPIVTQARATLARAARYGQLLEQPRVDR